MKERTRFSGFCLDREKDIIVDLDREGEDLFYVLRTPNHRTGNLITNLAGLCSLPVSLDENGLKVIKGKIPCYIDGYNRQLWIFRLGNTKIANIFPDGTVEMKASVPAISKTLMSQTKDYQLDIKKTIVKTYIERDVKFRTDLHTHMNANLPPDILIALGIAHQIRYPLYYIKKLSLRLTAEQRDCLEKRRAVTAEKYKDSPLTGKYHDRKIDDNTFLNFADLILKNPKDAAYNIPRIRASLAIMKDGQAVFTNLEKVYLYRYVFTKGTSSDDKMTISEDQLLRIPDADIRKCVQQMFADRKNPAYAGSTLFQDKLLWIARNSRSQGIEYLEISDTTLVKDPQAADMLAQVHQVMPAIRKETGVTIRFLAAIRRIALTIVKDSISPEDYFRENLQVLGAVAEDPYVAGADIIGEEINDIRELKPVLQEIVRIAGAIPGFTVRIHAGENDSLRDNVANSIACVKESLVSGQPMPRIRIGHGLYTADLHSRAGKQLIRDLKDCGAVLEFQITSNVRLNNLTSVERHPLKQYLAGGVRCVQGTDGGGIYGTGSIDEQLTLEKLLDLNGEEMYRMRQCEEEVCRQSLADFENRQETFSRKAVQDIAAYYREAIRDSKIRDDLPAANGDRKPAGEVLAGQIEALPYDRMPVVLVGGSFSGDRRTYERKGYGKRLIDGLLKTADPEKVFFMIGHKLTGYERYLEEKNRTEYGGKFRIYAMVPSMIDGHEAAKLKKSGVKIRVSIESSPMGLYKSIAYEVFKHRTSVLIALCGNSAGANMIQEAKNAKNKCRIYVSTHSRILRTKAASLQGYVTLFSDEKEILGKIEKDIN
ncbi:MAG: adenosine deaminase [Lachnospiraceae bacterium]|nr:adenosine deaminase [Lachnospiraceae bacterium]